MCLASIVEVKTVCYLLLYQVVITSLKKKISNNRLSIVNISSVATISIIYNSIGFIFAFFISITYKIFFLYNTKSTHLFQVSKGLFSNTNMTYLRIRVMITKLSYSKSYIWFCLINQLYQLPN